MDYCSNPAVLFHQTDGVFLMELLTCAATLASPCT